MLACTFHSFGARLLRMFGRDIGVEPTFTILSAEEQKAEIMAAAKTCATTDSDKGVAQLKYHQLAQGISRLRASGSSWSADDDGINMHPFINLGARAPDICGKRSALGLVCCDSAKHF